MLKVNFSVFASFSCQLFLLPITFPSPCCEFLNCKLYLVSLLGIYLIWSYGEICLLKSRKRDNGFLSHTWHFKLSCLLWQSHFFLTCSWNKEGRKERKENVFKMGMDFFSLEYTGIPSPLCTIHCKVNSVTAIEIIEMNRYPLTSDQRVLISSASSSTAGILPFSSLFPQQSLVQYPARPHSEH